MGEGVRSGSQRPRELTERCRDAGAGIRMRPGASARSSGDRPARAGLSTSGKRSTRSVHGGKGNGRLCWTESDVSIREDDIEDCDQKPESRVAFKMLERR